MDREPIEEKWLDLCKKTRQNPNDLINKSLFIAGAAAACVVAIQDTADKATSLARIMEYVGKYSDTTKTNIRFNNDLN